METKLMILTDLHLCHIDWYGTAAAKRLEQMVRQVQAYHAHSPFDGILMLGDYSLDFWAWSIGGSYLASNPVSNTDAFLRQYVARLPHRPFLLPGNHEQYGEARWRSIAHQPRQYAIVKGGYRILMLDTFGGELDPTVHSDGSYTGPSAEYLRYQLSLDEKPVILCGHHFDPALDSPSVRRLIKEEKRIKALFSGHVHHSRIEDYEGKPHLRCGHYSYASGDIRACMPGFRMLTLSETAIESRYVMPENTLITEAGPYHAPAAEQDAIVLTQ